MSESPDLLRDAEVLRKLLTECLRRVDRLERQLRTEAASAAEAEKRPAPPRIDPFEQALPDNEQADDDGRLAEPMLPPQPPPRGQRSASRPTVRTLLLSPTPRPNSKPAPSNDPHAGPAASHRASGPLDAFGEVDDWNAEPPSGDGSPDPFALLDLSVSPPESHDANLSRAMNDLLGGLDITPPNDEA